MVVVVRDHGAERAGGRRRNLFPCLTCAAPSPAVLSAQSTLLVSMAGLAGLLDPDCGGTNPLLSLTNHYREDAARAAVLGGEQPAGPEHGLVREFLSETRQAVGPARPANTFRMEGLLAELRELQPDSRVSRQPQLGPAVAELAAEESWAAEYLDTEDSSVLDWSQQYIRDHRLAGPDPLLAPPVRWADEYLAEAPMLKQRDTARAPNFATLEPAPVLDPLEFQDFIDSVGKSTEGSLGKQIRCECWLAGKRDRGDKSYCMHELDRIKSL